MSDYTQTTFFAPKDLLVTGNPDKTILGAEIDPEFSAISTAIATKYDSNDLASQAQAEGGTDSTTLMTPQRVQQWGDANAGILGDLRSLTDPLADRILFWDNSASRAEFLSAGTGISITATSITTNDAQIVHDSLSGFVGNEHIDHTTVTMTAGVGLSGGGDISANRTFNVDIPGTTLMPNTINSTTDTLLMYDASAGTHYRVPIADVTSSETGFVPNSRLVSAGSGLSGGGDLSANRTLSLDTGSSRNVDHGAVTITAGAGLTGGGTIAATRTLDVGAGSGITVNANDVALNTASTRNTDHASITLTAGVGLSGGGNITAGRTFDLDINGLVEEIDWADDDALAFYDTSAAAHRKIPLAQLPAGQTKYLTADYVVPSTATTYSDLTGLTGYEVEAGVYRIEGWIPTFYANSGTVNLQMQFNTITHSAGWWDSRYLNSGGVRIATNTNTTFQGGSGGLTWGGVIFNGVMSLTGSPGTIDFQIRYGTGTGNVTLEEWGYITLTKIA